MRFLKSLFGLVSHKKRECKPVNISSGFNLLSTSYDPETLISAIRSYCVGLIDTEILARYPVIQRNFSYNEITTATFVAILRAFVFIEPAYVKTHFNAMITASQNMVDLTIFNVLWDNLKYFELDNFSEENILRISQSYNMPVQGVIINMCAEWLFRYLTQNDTSVDSVYALDRISRSIARFFL